MADRHVVVAGASGLIGQAAIERFAALGWRVTGVSRRLPGSLPEGATALQLDLLDQEASRAGLAHLKGVTHVVYAALSEDPGLMPGWLDARTMERNAAMLRNLFDPLAGVSPALEHVSLMHGTKAYGLHYPGMAARVRNPLRERDPRVDHPNFYFLQEEYLREQQRGRGWGLTTFRPTVIYGGAGGNNMNPIPAIAAYAMLLKERGEPLHFPGQGEGDNLHEAVDTDLVASALAWAADSPTTHGEAYNLTNGDVFLWAHVWPAIAESLGMEPGGRRPMSLAEELPRRQDEWAAIVAKHALRASPDLLTFVGYNSLVYADAVMGAWTRVGVPFLNSTIKARQHGFSDCVDTEDMFRKWFGRLRAERVIA